MVLTEGAQWLFRKLEITYTTQDNEERTEVLQELGEFWKTSDSIFEALNLIQYADTFTRKERACYSLKRSIDHAFVKETFQIDDGMVENIKNLSIEILKNNRNTDFYRHFLNAITVFNKFYVSDWQAYHDLAAQLHSTGIEDDRFNCIQMIKEAARKVAPSIISENISFYIQIFQESASFSQKVQAEACQMIVELLKNSDEETKAAYNEIVSQFFELFQTSFTAFDEKLRYSVASSFAEFASNEKLDIDVGDFIGNIIGLLGAEGFPSNCVGYAFIPLHYIIEIHGPQLMDNESDLIEAVYTYAQTCIDESLCYDSNEQFNLVTYTCELITKFIGVNTFIEQIKALLSQEFESAAQIITVVSMLHHACGNLGYELERNLFTFIKAIVNFFEVENELVIESALVAISLLVKSVSEDMTDVTEFLIPPVLECLKSENNTFMEYGLDILQDLLATTGAPPAFNQAICEVLIELVQEDESHTYTAKAISIISAMIYSSKGDCDGEYIDQFVPIISEAAGIDPEDGASVALKCPALEALTNLAIYTERFREDAITCINEILQACWSTTDNVLRGSILVVLYKLIGAFPQEEFLATMASNIHIFIEQIFTTDLFAESDTMDFESNSEAINNLENVFKLMSTIAKHAPHLLPEDPGESLRWCGLCIAMMEIPNEIVQVAAADASVVFIEYLIKNRPDEDPVHFFESFGNMLKDASPSDVACVFRVISKLIERNTDGSIVIPSELLDQLVESGFQLFKGVHQCQNPEILEFGIKMWDSSNYEDVTDFFIAAIPIIPEFPLTEFVDLYGSVSSNEHLTALFVRICAAIYKLGFKGAKEVPPIVMGRIIEIVCETVENCASMMSPPEPIIAANEIFNLKPETIDAKSIIEQTLEYVSEEMQQEKYYWATVYSIFALALSYMRAFPQDAELDAATIGGALLPLLPMRVYFKPADLIMSCTVGILVQRCPSLAEEAARASLQTLGMRDHAFAALNLTENTINALKSFCKSLENIDGALQEVFADDEPGAQRCYARLQ